MTWWQKRGQIFDHVCTSQACALYTRRIHEIFDGDAQKEWETEWKEEQCQEDYVVYTQEGGEADIKVVADGVDEISDLVREIQV